MKVDLAEPTLRYDRKIMAGSRGDVIKSERQRRGWSQRTLARQAGITPGYVALLESGARTPGDELWVRLQRLFGIGTASGGVSEGLSPRVQTAALADAVTATRQLEISLPLPEEAEWFERVRFTTVVGPLGSGKTTFVARWLSEVASNTGRQIIWIQLTPTSSPESVEEQVLAQASSTDDSQVLRGAPSTGIVAHRLVRHLEATRRTPAILCFDDWDARAGGAHRLVADLAAALQRTPVVATTVSARSTLGGATVRTIPKPTDADWAEWCNNWHVPNTLRSDFPNLVHHNLLAASMLRSAVFFSSAASTPMDIEESWHRIVAQFPSRHTLEWGNFVSSCLNRVGETGSRVLRLAASSDEPIPQSWFGDDGRSADASKLLEYRLARQVQWGGIARVAVHPVIRAFKNELESDRFPWLSEMPPEPGLVNVLLDLEMVDEAAHMITALVEQWLPTSEAPPKLIDWTDRLPSEVVERSPMIIFGLVRALALRAGAGDLKRAAVTADELLASPLNDGHRWQALLLAADVAIRTLDYEHALALIELADRLQAEAAGSFDRQALDVLRARIYWEQSDFEAARTALTRDVGEGRVESARHASWTARVAASLGDYASAARAVKGGIEISRRSSVARAEAYNTVLLAEYELVRGNLGRARRLAERSAQIADARGLANLRAQALATQAETVSAQGETQEADQLLKSAIDAVAERADDPWTNAYLLVTQGRIARLQPLSRWTPLWSLGQMLEGEASAMRYRAERHPIVGTLLTESAHCWVATGYVHKARRVLDILSGCVLDWRTAWEAQFLDAVSSADLSDSERLERVATLIGAARDAGAPYLAVSCAYLASTYRLLSDDGAVADVYGSWVAEVAEARGWPVLASKARALSPEKPSYQRDRGERVLNSDGTSTLVAPRRGQRPARTDPEIPLPDPFDE